MVVTFSYKVLQPSPPLPAIVKLAVSEISINEMTHILRKNLLVLIKISSGSKKITLLPENVCFGSKICWLLTAMQIDMQDQGGSGATWHWWHDSYVVPCWWKWCCYNYPFVTAVPGLPHMKQGKTNQNVYLCIFRLHGNTVLRRRHIWDETSTYK